MQSHIGGVGVDFLVNRSDLSETTLAHVRRMTDADLNDDEALLSISAFGMTTNNVSYAAFGDALGYWQFFPAGPRWGRIPAWGFAEVTASKHPEIAIGERLFGFVPMSSHVVVRPGDVDSTAFIDRAPHRAAQPVGYNTYRRVSRDPGHDTSLETLTMLMFGLFRTAFVLDDFLHCNSYWDAEAVVVSSASSKTALALAHLLRHRREINSIGLTSEHNRRFVDGTGYFDRVAGYGDVGALDSGRRTLLVDLAGSGPIIAAVHERLGRSLMYSCLVGATHRTGALPEMLPGPTPQLFLAPLHTERLQAAWGRDRFDLRLREGWKSFASSAAAWLSVEESHGGLAVQEAYSNALHGRVPPSRGHVLSLYAG